MDHIEAIGFDLFNTLITLDPPALESAMDRLIHSLEGTGFSLKNKPFLGAYDHAVLQHLEKSRKTGKETHNRYWISAALHTLGSHRTIQTLLRG